MRQKSREKGVENPSHVMDPIGPLVLNHLYTNKISRFFFHPKFEYIIMVSEKPLDWNMITNV